MSTLPDGAWDAHVQLPTKAAPDPPDGTNVDTPDFHGGSLVRHTPAHNLIITMSLADKTVDPVLSAIESINSMHRKARGTVMLDPDDMSVARLRTLDAKGVRSVRIHVAKVVAEHGANIDSVEKVIGTTARSMHEADLHWPVDAQLSLSTWARLADVLEDMHKQYGTVFVADHMFCADASAAGTPVLRTVLDLVEKGIVYVKVCGMAKFAPQLEDLRPIIQAVLRCKEGTMALWGSDWPHADLHGNTTVVDVEQQVAFLHGICREEGEGYWEKLTRDNAERLYA